MNLRSVLLAAAFLSAPGVATAQSNNALATSNFNLGGTLPPNAGAREAAELRFTRDMEALRKDGLALQAMDGGNLTPEHRIQLQTRLDRINAVYQERIGRSDGLNVNADGSRRF